MSRMVVKLAIDLPPELHEWFISTAKALGLSQNQFLQKLRELWEKSRGKDCTAEEVSEWLRKHKTQKD